MRIIHISDTWTTLSHIRLPTGDVLVHSGNFCESGTVEEIFIFNSWLGLLKPRFKKLFVIIGRNDIAFLKNSSRNLDFYKHIKGLITNACVLNFQFIEFEGISFYGAPYCSEEELATRLNMTDTPIHVFVTHNPAKGYMDGDCGSEVINKAIQKNKVNIHLHGSIMSQYGSCSRPTSESNSNCLVLSSIISSSKLQPQVVEITQKGRPKKIDLSMISKCDLTLKDYIRYEYLIELAFYRKFHRNKINKVIHIFCVPMETSAFFTLPYFFFLNYFSKEIAQLFLWLSCSVMWGYYFILLDSFTVSFFFLPGMQYAIIKSIDIFDYHGALFLWIIVAAVGWTLQIFVGHWIFEKNSPAFTKQMTLNSVLMSMMFIFDHRYPELR